MMGRRFFISGKAWLFPTAESTLKTLTNKNFLWNMAYNNMGFFMQNRLKNIMPALLALILVFLVFPDSKGFAFR
jgi:hypothetical protein